MVNNIKETSLKTCNDCSFKEILANALAVLS